MKFIKYILAYFKPVKVVVTPTDIDIQNTTGRIAELYEGQMKTTDNWNKVNKELINLINRHESRSK